MKNLLLSLCLIVALAAAAPAQIDQTKAKRSEAIMTKIGQLDLLVHIVPLALEKEQINKLLPVIEKARANSYKIINLEADDLAKLEKRVSDAVDASLNKGEYPPKDLLEEIAKTTHAFTLRRQLAGQENIESVYGVVSTALNEGQRKVMENSLDPKLLGVKEDMDSTAKIKFFIRQILLDPRAYDLLLKMSK